MTLLVLDSMPIDHAGDDQRVMMLCYGDVSQLQESEGVDYMAVSAAAQGEQTRSVNALAAAGLKLDELADDKAADYLPAMPCWVSRDVSAHGLNFDRVIVFEPPAGQHQAQAALLPSIFRALHCFAKDKPVSVVVSTELPGQSNEDFIITLRQLFFAGVQAAARREWPLQGIKLVVSDQNLVLAAKEQFEKLKNAYNDPPIGNTAANLPKVEPGQALYPPEITRRQYLCIRSYTSAIYMAINRALKLDDLSDSHFQYWQATIEGISSGLMNLTSHQGMTYRGADLDKDELAEYQIGAMITHSGFTSSSVDSPFERETLLEIECSRGKPIMDFSVLPEENEVLYDHHMQDRVTAKRAGNQYKHIFTSKQHVPDWCGD